MIGRLLIEISKTVASVVIFMSVLLILGYLETHYTRLGTVEKKTGNNYYFYDSVGHVWEFTSDEKLTSGMDVEVFMFNNCTEEYIYDDMIIDYKVLSKNKI